MKTNEDILKHCASTVYTHNARRSIVEWLLQHNVIPNKRGVKFANHVYMESGIRLTEGKSFEDFLEYYTEDLADDILDALKIIVDNLFPKSNEANGVDGICVGDVVKYIPTPDNTSDEYVMDISYNKRGDAYFLLSNGELVKPCYCVKYKYQGDERRELIDKLNEVL